MNRYLLCLFFTTVCLCVAAQEVPKDVMEHIYQEVKTPYKYGLVMAPADNYHKFDCPTVFREQGKWYMTYVCYDGKDGTDGRGYTTWLAESDDLLHWVTKGKILDLPPAPSQGGGAQLRGVQPKEQQKQDKNTGLSPSPSLGGGRGEVWDHNQRGGFPGLIDWTWGGSYEMQAYKGQHWMTYIGGSGTGYEAVNAPLSIGVAITKSAISSALQWTTYPKPLMSYNDKDAQWWEQLTQYKSTVYWIKDKSRRIEKAYPFTMFYNAGGKDATHPKGERIGIALSKDMRHWKRYYGNPVFAHDSDGTITGDAQIVDMSAMVGSPLYVMFYFSAFNPTRDYNAFNTFAASTDLVHWQDWSGADLIIPSKPYDEMFAHKSYVVKHDGVVYHFYCAVNNNEQRGIAVATSVPMGRSEVRFPAPEPTGRRTLTSLNEGWKVKVGDDTPATSHEETVVALPHNLDDYYGYRQLRHGNLHGSATYSKVFTTKKQPERRYFLQFEGVGTYATVTLNGHAYPRELVGRTVWTLDVTDHLRHGENRLKVAVDHPALQTESPWVCGGCSSEWGFSEGSQPFGLFRPVTLVATDAVRIEPFGVHIWNNAACDSVYIDTEVKNYSPQQQTVELVSKFSDAGGKQVFRLTETVSLAAGETKTVRQSAAVDHPRRWSLEKPYLYRLATLLKRDGKTTDDVQTPFGIRSIEWPRAECRVPAADHPSDNDRCDHRFRLNGEPVFINGTCEYEHLLGQSHAFSREQIAARVKMIRQAGFNAFREAHQPHNLYYQQLLDEHGMLFWSQFSAHIWYDTPAFRANFKRLLERWIKERRNSPSVILWGLQNESVLPKDFAEECSELIRRLDPTASTMRLITTCNGGEGTDWNVIQNWSGTYGGNADNYAEELSRSDQLLNGEYGAWRTLDLHGADKYSEESFTELLEKKARLAEEAYRGAASAAGVCGHFQWLFTSHDNPGRVQPDGALRRIDKLGPINYKGLLTTWEEPTQAYYMYRQRYVRGGETNGESAATLPSAADRNVDLVKGADGWSYVYRINCGGDDYTDEFGQKWNGDRSEWSHSWGMDFDGINALQASQRHITTDIRGTHSDTLFQFFRFGRHRLWYDLPVDDGEYRVELYFTEPWHGRNADRGDDYEGLRIYDVAINGETVIDDLDPWAESGYCGAMKRVVVAKATGGRLRISFPEVKVGQAVVCAIAVARAEKGTSADEIGQNSARFATDGPSWHALDTDTIAKLPQALLPADAEARPASTYDAQPSKRGVTTFVIQPGLGQEYALRFRYQNTTGKAVVARLKIVDSKQTTLVDRQLTFPPTPAKLKMLSTTTGTQINAGTYRLTIEAPGVEFKNLELQ